MERLPIYEIEADLVAGLQQSRRVILQAPTGSGKSTQVPQMLLQHGLLEKGQVIILQPRRLAARLLARRVALELGVNLGQTVGYQVRFENASGPHTTIKYVTEGVLLRQLLRDPNLPGVSTVIFDEFHERHLYGDVTLARALDLQSTARGDLRIIVMSATLDQRLLRPYLEPCAVLSASGRTYPVDIRCALHRARASDPPVWQRAADAFAAYARLDPNGDVLVFMPGGYEIQRTIEAIRRCPESRGRLVLPLYGELPPGDQDAAVALYDRPKVVVATNVAETSLTIEGVRCVIDSGLARVARYDPHRGINTLLIEKISQASADQRAGRAGRTAPGVCHRLWSQSEHEERAPQETPEIRRLDLAEVALMLKAAGTVDLSAFPWLEPPPEKALGQAETLLADLGAVDREGQITGMGRRMLAFPLHPRYSRLLLAAESQGCVYHAALMAALTQGRDLLLRRPPREGQRVRDAWLEDNAQSDFQVLMRAWEHARDARFNLEECKRVGIHAQTARQVGPLHQHFLRIAESEGLDVQQRPLNENALRRCILVAFSDRVARRLDQGTLRCDIVHGRRGTLVRESVVQNGTLFVAAEVREVEGRHHSVETLLSLATAIESEWLKELFPEDCTERTQVSYDASMKRVCAEAQHLFRDLALSTRRVEPPPADEAARILAQEVAAGRLTLKHWDHGIEQWILRLNRLSEWCPDLELPPIGTEERRHLIEQICHGAFSYKEIKDRQVRSTVQSWLSPAQRDSVERLAPERLSLGAARKPKVTYVADGEPYVALRIQELYGVTETPHIAQGRVPVLVHILAPNMRPVQITRDLSGFWREQYPKVRQELQRRYPKHEWR